MKKIVIAGCGAYHFAPAILEDLLVRYRMPSELWLVDSDLGLAELTARAAQKLADAFEVRTRFFYTADWKRAIPGADAVVVTADFLEEDAWRMDYEALDAVGLGKQVRLSGGLGGLMQTLRACGFIAALAEQMRDSCPRDAVLLLCDSGFGGLPLARACEVARLIGIRAYGISGVAEQTLRRMALYLDIPEQALELVCAGLSGFSWIAQMQSEGKDLIPRAMEEIRKDEREALAAQYIDWYQAIPAGDRVMQYELLADTELSPRRTVVYSGVGAADAEVRKNRLAALAVYGPKTPQGAEAWAGIRSSGLKSARPIEVLRALWGEGACQVESLTMPCDGAVPGVRQGRFVEGPATVDGDGAHGQKAELPIELWDVMEQISLCHTLYAESAATGNRDAMRQALEIDPALSGVDLLYAEEILDQMMTAQRDRLERFFTDEED